MELGGKKISNSTNAHIVQVETPPKIIVQTDSFVRC